MRSILALFKPTVLVYQIQV